MAKAVLNGGEIKQIVTYLAVGAQVERTFFFKCGPNSTAKGNQRLWDEQRTNICRPR
jgi:hypothetical protein